MTDFQTLRYESRDRKAYITLSRPDRLNAIDDRMPRELRTAVEWADADRDVHVIILGGDGPAFCAGYDMKKFAEMAAANGTRAGLPGMRCKTIVG
jgi:enoyl-CoA hydratase